MPYSIILGILLLTVSGTTVACGLYAAQGNEKSCISKLFSAVGFALVIWAFGQAMTLAGANEEIALIGRRIAFVGSGMIFALFLHFILLVTNRTELLKKWWIYLLLYFPGLVTIYAQTILPLLGKNQETLVKTKFGWIDLPGTGLWDWFYYLYYLTFVVITVAILLGWGRHAAENTRKQARLLVSSIVAATILGTTTNLLPAFFQFHIPQIASLFLFLPIIAISYSVSHYGFIRPKNKHQNEIILSEPARLQIYRYISFMFIAGSFLNIIGQRLLYQPKAVDGIWVFSGILFLIGAFIHIVSMMKVENSLKEILVAGTFSFFIPFIILRYIRFGGITIWAGVFLLMIICLLFNRRILLGSIVLSAILTQLFIWIAAPSIMVEVNKADYIIRVGLIVIAAILSFYANNVYVRRLKENGNQIHRQTIVAEISHSFISASEFNFNEKIYNMLKSCGEFIKADTAYMILLNKETGDIRYSCEWVAENAVSQMNFLRDCFNEMKTMLIKELAANKIIQITDTSLIPLAAGKLNERYTDQGIRSFIGLPIKKHDEIIGMIGFTSSQPAREWETESTVFLQIVSNTAADAVVKVESEKEIKFLAYHDQLTSLPNRVVFEDRLEQSIRLAGRMEKMVGVAFIDLDFFKSINDTMGHHFGDYVLQKIAKRLSGCIRNYDTVARFGGDEFILLFNQLSSTKDAITVMEKIMAVIHKPLTLRGQEFFLTASAGVALYPRDGENTDELIKNADAAMYISKSLGKNRYTLCSQDIKDDILEKMKLTNLLYRALERKQLLLYYQPQINIETNTIVGFEALIRWKLPARGCVSPVVFIPLAEQTGLINPIGEWVLQTACQQNKHWHDMGFTELRMAVNISIHQLKNPHFVNQVAGILEKTGLSPNCLELEVTESLASSDTNGIVSVLGKLKALGVSISIDDFGTEYSSLSRLKLLPIDRIKMDMQFVQGIGGSKKDQAITKVIISLAKSLNLKIIAEGVETKLQLNFLSQKMCDEVQGYYYFKPMPAEQAESIIKKGLKVHID